MQSSNGIFEYFSKFPWMLENMVFVTKWRGERKEADSTRESVLEGEEIKTELVLLEVAATTHVLETPNIWENPEDNVFDDNVDEDVTTELDGIQVATQVEKEPKIDLKEKFHHPP